MPAPKKPLSAAAEQVKRASLSLHQHNARLQRQMEQELRDLRKEEAELIKRGSSHPNSHRAQQVPLTHPGLGPVSAVAVTLCT